MHNIYIVIFKVDNNPFKFDFFANPKITNFNKNWCLKCKKV